MNTSLYNGLILAGVFQGLVFGITILALPKYKSRSTMFLAFLILCFSLSTLQFTLEESGIITHDELFEYIHVPWSVLIAPFLYFYVVTFLYPNKTTTLLEKSLFVPFIIMTLVSMAYKVMADMDPTDPRITEPLYKVPFWGNYYGDLLNTIFIFFIILVLFGKMHRYEVATSIYNPEQLKIKLNWLKATLLILFFLIATLSYTTIKFENDTNVVFFPLYVGIAVTIYWLGYIGIYKSGIVEQRKKIREHVNENKKTSVSENRQNDHISTLNHILVTEKKFLDQDLTLESTAKAMNISKGHLSRVINTEMETGFSEYVNTLRTEEAKSYLLNPEFSNYTLVAIGLEAGFNSKSTFYSAFKKITGETPSQFKSTHGN